MCVPRCALMRVTYVCAQVCSDVCDVCMGTGMLWCVMYVFAQVCSDMCVVCVCPGVLWCVNGCPRTVLWRLFSPFPSRWALEIELSLQAFETTFSSPTEPYMPCDPWESTPTHVGQQLLSQLTLPQVFVISTSGSPTFLLSKVRLRGLCTKLSPAETNTVFLL